LNTVQINKYNKLNIEIFTKVTNPIKLNKINLRFNEPSLNQEVVGEFTLSKDNPVMIERELYISKDN
jgi:hypothetical protein